MSGAGVPLCQVVLLSPDFLRLLIKDEPRNGFFATPNGFEQQASTASQRGTAGIKDLLDVWWHSSSHLSL